MSKVIKFGNTIIGDNCPCYVMLEAGVNFDNIKGVRKLIDSAVNSGANAIKFQTFHADTTVVKGVNLRDGRGIINQYEELKESEKKQTKEFQEKLFLYAKQRKITAFSTPSHYKDVDLLEEIASPPIYKVGSDDLSNIPLLKYIARLKKPIIISSGVSYLSEIDSAIRAIREEGNDKIVLLHCVSQYPANPEDLNLKKISLLRQIFDIPVGLSDHTTTLSIPIAAVALGACVIEKHYTLDRDAPGPDNFFSMLPSEIKSIVKKIREVELALGNVRNDIGNSEKEMRKVFRKSIHAVKDIRKGEIITRENIDTLRPLGGIDPALMPYIFGMRIQKNMLSGEPLTWDCFK